MNLLRTGEHFLGSSCKNYCAKKETAALEESVFIGK